MNEINLRNLYERIPANTHTEQLLVEELLNSWREKTKRWEFFFRALPVSEADWYVNRGIASFVTEITQVIKGQIHTWHEIELTEDGRKLIRESS